MANKNQSEGRTLGFLILSSFFHTALAIGVFTLSFEAKKMVDITEVEFLDTKPALAPKTEAPLPAQANIAPVEQTQEVVEEKVAEAPAVETPIEKPVEKIVEKAQPEKIKALAPVIAKALPKAAAKSAQAEKPAMTQEASPVVVPELESADLSEAALDNEAPTELKDEDIAGDLDKVDQEHAEKAVALQNELEKETEKDLKEQDEKLAALQNETAQENAKLAADNAKKRAEERAAAQAAQIAAEEEAARIASPAGVENGSGSGAGEIKALEDMKQVAGNKRPAYDAEDRLQGRQGEVAFLAYVSKNGGISEFKLIKSSGHRQLDSKTLKALRDWKFYPGQEGWVEIPFKWDLKGGPQEMPATLRRAKVSSQY